jgi:hypothetical protein
MAAQPNEFEPFTDSYLAARSDVSAGIDFLIERGALPRAQRYAGITRVTADRFIAIARPHGAREQAFSHFFETKAAAPEVPGALGCIVAILRAILENFPSYRSALFVPAPALSAFAVANLELPIVYGSGLLRRTPRPIAIAPWERELSASSVLSVVRANPDNAAVLLANRGVVAYSNESFSKLAKFVVSLEESAQLTINARLLGGARALPPDAYEQMQQGIAGD